MVRKIGAAAMTAFMFMAIITGCTGNRSIQKVKTVENTSDKPRLFVQAEDVSYDEKDVSDKYLDYVFEAGKRFVEDDDENVMISPASIFFAMEMAASGASGNTLDEMTAALVPGASNEEALKYAADYYKQLQKTGVVNVANAEYFSEDFNECVYEDYLEYVKENFDAEITVGLDVKKINEWVDDKTDGMIPEILDESDIDESTAAVLLNAIAFEADWEDKYDKKDVLEDEIFTDAKGREEDVVLLRSEEEGYYETDKAIGFMKYYKDDEYAFVAMLPTDETISANEFMADLSADDYREFLDSRSSTKVKAFIPEFEYDYSNGNVIEIFRDMGVNDAFEGSADFSNMASMEAFISKIVHKTHISVDRKGTKAAAATAIVMTKGAMPDDAEEIKIVTLDRPFVYMIVETENMTPVFMGTVNSVN